MSTLHVGLPYQNLNEYIEAAVTYLQAQSREREAIIVVGTAPYTEALRKRLGPDADRCDFMDSESWYRTPARAFTRYMNYWHEKQRAGYTALRIFGQPLAYAAPDEQIQRWVFYENAMNDVMAECPFTMMCAYDMRMAPLEHSCVSHSHPYLASAEKIVLNSDFVDPSEFAQARFAEPPSYPSTGVQTTHFRPGTTSEARHLFTRVASECGLSPARISESVIAVGEAIANAIEHGGGAGTLSVFRTGNEVVCDITNERGAILDVLQGYFMPALGDERGRGIWIMRQMCDWVDLYPINGGATVRLHTYLNVPEVGQASM